MGTLFWKPFAQGSFQAFAGWARAEGVPLIGTSAHAQTDYRELRIPGRWALLMGSEQSGLSSAQLQACEQSVSLPMRGRASSLNLAVATGILLYALARG
jgi:TrmH family RNA methyltransferase